MRHPLRLATGLGLLAAAIAGIAWWWLPSAPPADAAGAFLDAHWQRPLQPQGPPPAGFSALEASLAPASCGSCHQAQWQDWRQSLHARALGAGLLWQFHLMPAAAANGCLDCHAPLAEQKALLARELGWSHAPASAPPAYVAEDLAGEGVACAACHLRRHERFGPPAAGTTTTTAAHGGFSPTPAFEDSRFCSSCHQFPADGPRTAGKLREDTYAQWQASRFAEEGQSCQSCHMPERRHLWQGIHSPAMVQSALTATLELRDGMAHASLANTGAGHFFPTYLVPELRVQLVLKETGVDDERLLAESIIGWRVDIDLEHEFFDTRLPPGGSLAIEAGLPGDMGPAAEVILRLAVAPGEHYERSFASVLAQRERLDAATLALLEQALEETRGKRYSLVLAQAAVGGG